jgi:mRNA interferase RelE/StbE
MTYKLVFKQDAQKEWHKLDDTIRQQFKKKLKEHLANPRVEAARLSGMKDCYKIK